MFYYFTNILLYDFSTTINFALNKKRGEQMNESPQYQIEQLNKQITIKRRKEQQLWQQNENCDLRHFSYM